MLIIDLEDAVAPDHKSEARLAMVAAVQAGFPGKLVAVRINGRDSADQAADIAALAGLDIAAIVVPKVDAMADLVAARSLGKPVLAMIETPLAIYAAPAIAADGAVAGLIAGLNDLAHELKLPDTADRTALSFAIQNIVMAARSAGKFCFDGVYNAIDDGEGFALEAADGRRLGFDGKTLIHPAQIAPCNIAFSPTEGEIAAARAMVAAAGAGAQRFEGRMIEDMHVAAARQLLARVGK